MTIHLPTGQAWSVQLVCIGSRLLLEAVHDDLRYSAWLQPQDSPTEVAYGLIQHPACALEP
jgi:hypothetical protein